MFTIKDGLPGSMVSSVMQDTRGYLWIGTEGGLSRYDGSTFKNYSFGNGLPSYITYYDFEDSTGHIWFHYKEGVCDFDGTHFITYPIESPPKNIWITQLLFTESHKIWFVTGKGMFELQNGIWKRHDLIYMSPHTFLNQVVELNDHSLLFNCLDSLMIRFVNGKCRTIAHSVSKDQPFQFISSIEGNSYVSTRSHLYLFRDNRLELIHDDVLANKWVRTVFMDREHRLWVGTLLHGIYVFSGNSHIQINPSKEHIYSIENFCQDYEGNIWVATSSGLMKLSSSWVEFYHQKGVRSSFKDQNGTLYFGQTKGGFMFRKNNKFISSHTVLDKSSVRMVDNWIQGFACDEQKRLWLTDNNHNLLRITGGHAENMNNKLGLSLNTWSKVFFNPFDSTVYAGSTHGLIEIKNDLIHEKTLYSEGEDRIYTFASDPAGNIWMGSGKGKIFEKRGNNIFLLNRELRIDSIAISKIKCPGSNELWISTVGSGIYKFHRNRSGSFVQDFHISSSDGLPNDYVLDFTFGKGGKVWIITLAGLASVQFYTAGGKENFAVTKYGEEEGFHNKSFLYSSLVTDNNGNVWLGTDDYIAQIHSDQVLNDTIPPIIQIENVKLFNSNTEWGKYASGFIPFFHLPKNPMLPHHQNDIAIEYKSISFNDPGNITYSYKLEGIDEEWNSNGNNTHITFGNLSPGNYVFKVRAKKPLSAWSSPEAQFSFTINSPWWGTIWFKALVAILLIYISYLIYKIRLKQILAKAKIEKQISEKMLHERLRISRELHDDIGSALGSISIYSEVAKNRTEKNENAEEALSKIGITSRQLIDKMSDIVWSLDSANENFEQLQNRMRAFLAMILTPLNLIYDFFVAEEIKKIQLSDEERKNIFLIFKEAIYNIVKYAESNKVDIILNMEDEVFKMLIRDDGKGFDINSNDAYNGNGIRNMYARAKDINAIFILHSKKSEGTTIELSLAV